MPWHRPRRQAGLGSRSDTRFGSSGAVPRCGRPSAQAPPPRLGRPRAPRAGPRDPLPAAAACSAAASYRCGACAPPFPRPQCRCPRLRGRPGRGAARQSPAARHDRSRRSGPVRTAGLPPQPAADQIPAPVGPGQGRALRPDTRTDAPNLTEDACAQPRGPRRGQSIWQGPA